MTEVIIEEARLIEDPLIEVVSPSAATNRKGEDLTCPPIHPPSSLTMTARH
jgi:hypothetical protein